MAKVTKPQTATKVIYKKNRSVAVASSPICDPAFRTRDQARALATKIRAAGVSPSTPTKTADGWRVTAKHAGGTLSRNMHK